MIFINVQYPANVAAFFAVFNFGNLDFLQNPMDVIFTNLDEFSLPVPQKFEDYEVDGLFLANAGNMLLLWGLNILTFGASYLFLRYTRNMPRTLTKFCTKTVNVFMWSGTMRTFITSFMEISIASFLQLGVLTFESSLTAISSICGILFGLFSVLLPVFAYKIVRKFDSDPIYVTQRFDTLVEEYKQNDDIHKYFTVIALGKNLIFAASLVYLHDYPYTEIITIISITFSHAYLFFKYKPCENNLNNNANAISEAIFGIIYLLIFILIHDDYSSSFSDNTRMDLGWAILMGCGIILMVSIVVALAEQYTVMKNTVNMIRTMLKDSKKTREKRRRKFKENIDKTNIDIEMSREYRRTTDNANLISDGPGYLTKNQQKTIIRLKKRRRDVYRKWR